MKIKLGSADLPRIFTLCRNLLCKLGDLVLLVGIGVPGDFSGAPSLLGTEFCRELREELDDLDLAIVSCHELTPEEAVLDE